MSLLKNKILAIIPCRSGSKEIRNKNLVKFNNKTLIEYSIHFAKECKFFDKIIVSTDSNVYKKISEKNGISVPFLRPKKISKDRSTDYEFITHCLKYLKDNQNFKPDLIVHLRPTSPLRKIKDLKYGLRILIKNKKIDSLKTITKMKHSVFKTWFSDRKKLIRPSTNFNLGFKEPYNLPRQMLPLSYKQTALFDIYRRDIVINKKNLSGKKIFGLELDSYLDIDSKEDIVIAKRFSKHFKNFRKFIFS